MNLRANLRTSRPFSFRCAKQKRSASWVLVQYHPRSASYEASEYRLIVDRLNFTNGRQMSPQALAEFLYKTDFVTARLDDGQKIIRKHFEGESKSAIKVR